MNVLQVTKKRIGYFLFKVRNTFFVNSDKYSYYDKHLDEIVVGEDCSYSEIYCGKRVALLEKNHVFGKKHIGFMIFGVRHFLLTCQVDMFETQKVNDILEKMRELCPKNEFPQERLKIIHSMIQKSNLEVYVPPISK